MKMGNKMGNKFTQTIHLVLVLAAALAIGILISPNPCVAAMLLPEELAGHPGGMPPGQSLRLILEDLAGERADLVRIQRELVRRPGINPEDGGEGEAAKARWIEAWLAREGLPPPERVDCPDDRVPAGIRPNLILRYPQVPRDRPTLWVVGYLDNSTPGNTAVWTSSPMSLRVVGDHMYGLGVTDNNDAIAATLLLLRSLHRNRSDIAVNLGVLLIAGEKAGLSRVGLLHVLKERPDYFKKSDPFLLLSYGTPNGEGIGVGEKGLLWLKLLVRGTRSHSSRPDLGKNPLAAGGELIAALPGLAEKFPARNELFDLPTSSFVPTKPATSEMALNQIPGEFSFHLDIRLLPGYRLEDARAAVEENAAAVAKKYGVSVEVEQILARPTSPVTPPDNPLVLALGKALEAQLGLQARRFGVGAVSPASDLRKLGFSAAVWQWAGVMEMGHMVDEAMSVAANLAEAELVARLLFDSSLAVSAPAEGE